MLSKREVLRSGKVKTLHLTEDPKKLICVFRNDTTLYRANKHAVFEKKGHISQLINTWVMKALERAGIPTHFESEYDECSSVVKRLDMFPLECIVRNRAAGGLCRRLGIEKGRIFSDPLFEFCYKADELDDPLVNTAHILTFGWANSEQIKQIRALSLAVNEVLRPLFERADLLLVDYKLEFGLFDGACVLGDEFTPDGCRLWDKETQDSLDKDRFREDLGGVVPAYQEVFDRLCNTEKA